MKTRHQQQVARDVAAAGDGHGHQRRGGIADAAEHAADEVVGDDHQRARAADAHIGHRKVERLRRGLHHRGDRPRAGGDERRHDQRDDAEQHDARADGLAALAGVALADLLAQQDGRAHGEAGHQVGQRHHDVGAGGHRGDVRRRAELAHHQQVHRAVHRLQKQRRQHRQREPHQRREYPSFRKVVGVSRALHTVPPGERLIRAAPKSRHPSYRSKTPGRRRRTGD